MYNSCLLLFALNCHLYCSLYLRNSFIRLFVQPEYHYHATSLAERHNLLIVYSTYETRGTLVYLRTPPRVNEQILTLSYIVWVDLLSTIDLGQNARRSQ